MSLRDKLKEKGHSLSDEKHAAPEKTEHKKLQISAKENLQVFTPLEVRGGDAVKAEQKRNREIEKDRLKGAQNLLVRWVQESLASKEKKDKLHEKGFRKCRFQLQWSTNLNKDLRAFVAGFGGRIAAAGDTPQAEEALRNFWMVAFDFSAFERLMKAHPKVLGPSDVGLKKFIEDHINTIDIENTTVKKLIQASESKFGPITPATKTRVKQIAAEVVGRIAKYGADGKVAKNQKTSTAGPKKPVVQIQSILKSPEDATWAAEMLAPLGIHAGTQEPAVKSPVSVVARVLAGLKSLEPTADLLKTTGLGIIVNNYRSHASPEVASAAKELISTWKQTCLTKKRKAEDQPKRSLQKGK